MATYEFDVTDLEHPGVYSFHKAVTNIKMKINGVLNKLEYDKGQSIEWFSIGKTYAHKIQRAYCLNPLDETTFTKKGIQDRWTVHQQTEYGKDGMVVVAVITDAVADQLGYHDPQECALDIERELQQQYQRNDDSRLWHESYHRGALENSGAEGYPLYITYAFSEEEEEEEEEEEYRQEKICSPHQYPQHRSSQQFLGQPSSWTHIQPAPVYGSNILLAQVSGHYTTPGYYNQYYSDSRNGAAEYNLVFGVKNDDEEEVDTEDSEEEDTEDTEVEDTEDTEEEESEEDEDDDGHETIYSPRQYPHHRQSFSWTRTLNPAYRSNSLLAPVSRHYIPRYRPYTLTLGHHNRYRGHRFY